MLTSPRPRGPDTELSDLLDHCVTLGEETGDILDQFEQRVVLVSAHWSRPRHVTSCRPLIGPLCRWCRATCLRATAPLWRRSTPRCSRRPSTAWSRTEVRRGGEDDLYIMHRVQERAWDCHGGALRLTSTWSTGWGICNIYNI